MTTLVTIVLLGVIAVGVVASFLHTSTRRRSPGRVSTRVGAGGAEPESDQLSFYQIAHLAGGRRRVALAALAYLVWSGLLEVRDGSRTIALRKPPPADVSLAPVEEAILRRVSLAGTPVGPVQGAAEVAADWAAEGMPGLATPPREAWRSAGLAIVPALFALGVSLLVILARNGERLGLLVVVPLVALVVVMVAWAGRPGVTRAGRVALEATARRYDEDMELASVGVTSLPVERGMYIVALYGRKALTGGLLPLRRVTRP